jgi:PAS domain S-box-containing protein
MPQQVNQKERKAAGNSGRTPELIFITDRDLQVTYINQNVSRQLFQISEMKPTRKITDYLPNLNVSNLKSKISELTENKISFETSYRINPGDKKKPDLKLLISASNNDQNKHLLWKVVPRQKSPKSILKPDSKEIQLKFLEKFSGLLSSHSDLQIVLTRFARELKEIISFTSLSLFIPYFLEKYQFSLYYFNYRGENKFPKNEIIDLTGNDIYYDVIHDKKCLIQNNPSKNTKHILTSAELKYSEKLTEIIHLPVFQEEEILGILNIGHETAMGISKEDLNFLSQISGFLAVALKNAFNLNLVRLQNKKLFIINSIFNAPQTSNNILQICQNTLTGLTELLGCEISSFYRSTDGQKWQKIILPEFKNKLPNQLRLPEIILEEKTRIWDKINPSIVDLEATEFEEPSQTGLFSWQSSSSFGYFAFLSLNNTIFEQINRSYVNSLIEDTIKQMIIALDQISLFEKVKRAEKEWETTFNTVNIGLLIVDENLQIIRSNKAFDKLFDYEHAKLIGQTCEKTICRNKQNCFCSQKTVRNTSFRQEEDEYFDDRIYRKIRRIFYPIHDSQNKFKGAIFSIQDVTEQRKQEARIKFLSSFPETSPNLIISLDSNTEINYLNPAALALVKELKLKENEYKLILPKNITRIQRESQQANVPQLEAEHKFKDRLFHYVIHKPKDDDHFYFYGTEITEKVNLQKQLLQTERIKAVGEMAAGVAHDFNNLLATILGRTQLLLLKSEHGGTKDELKIIEKAAIDGGKIVRRLQEVTKEKREKDFTSLDINELIKESIIFTASKLKISTQLKGQKVLLHTRFKNKCIVKGDEVELKEVFTNLLLNAYDAMPKGGELFIETKIIDKSKVRILFKDTGVGMPEDIKNKIFNPFFTTKGDKGTGMGLSIVYKAITSHKGYIGVRSKKNKGTVFTIILPLSNEPIKKLSTKVSQIQEKYSETSLLIVDDEPELLDTMAEILRLRFKSVEIASSGKEAMNKIEERKYDVVLSDLGMPEMSGWELAQKIKSKFPKSNLIMVTGWGEQAKEELKYHPEVDAILPKPYSFDELITLINSFYR